MLFHVEVKMFKVDYIAQQPKVEETGNASSYRIVSIQGVSAVTLSI